MMTRSSFLLRGDSGKSRSQRFLLPAAALLFLLLCLPLVSPAAKRYWLGASNSWNDTKNWSNSSGGTGYYSVPGSSDTAYFDSNGAGDCDIDNDVTVKQIEVASSFGNIITQQSGYIITVEYDFKVYGGTFVGGDADINVNDDLLIDGSSTGFTSTTAALHLYNDFTLSNSATFTHNSGTAYFHNSGTIAGTITFYVLEFAPEAASTITVSNTITCESLLTLSGSFGITLNTGTIDIQGDATITNTSSSGGGTATFNFTGSNSQSFTGSGTNGAGRTPHVTINKSGGALYLLSTISAAGNWTYTAGTVDPGTSSVPFYGNYNVDGQGTSATMSFYKMAVGSGTRTLTGNVDVNNDFTISSGTTLSAGSYTMNVGGQWNNNGTWTYGTSTVVFDGGSYKKIKKASSALETFYNLTFNRNFSGASMTLDCPVKVTNALTMTKGKVKTTSTYYLEVADNATASGGHDSAYVHGPMRKTGNDAFTFPLGDTVSTSAAYHPLGISAPATDADQFEAEYKRAAQSQGSAIDEDSLEVISSCEYWKLVRNAGSVSVKPTLGWNTNNCIANGPTAMRVSRWNGSQWVNMGYDGSTGNSSTGTVTASSTYSFSSTSYLVLAQKRHKQYFIINTAGTDTLNDDDTLKYVITRCGLSGTWKAGTARTFQPLTPNLSAGSDSCELRFYYTGQTDTTRIRFTVNHYGVISNVRAKISTLQSLDTTLYKVVQDTVLVLLNGKSTWQEQFIPPVEVLLEDGMVMSPNGDSSYDTFVVQGTGGYTSYQLTIYDRTGSQVYQTTNPANAWNGLDGSSNPVQPGTYRYDIVVDGQTITGQFLLEY